MLDTNTANAVHRPAETRTGKGREDPAPEGSGSSSIAGVFILNIAVSSAHICRLASSSPQRNAKAKERGKVFYRDVSKKHPRR